MPPTFNCPPPNATVSQQFGATGTYPSKGEVYIVCKATYNLASGPVSCCMRCAYDGTIFGCQFDLGPDVPSPPSIALSAQAYNQQNMAVDGSGTLALTFAAGLPNPCPNAGQGTSVPCP